MDLNIEDTKSSLDSNPSWKSLVLKKRKDFLYVQNCGQKYFSRNLSLFFISPSNQSTEQKFGITVSTKVSKSSVVRNKIKRRIRNIIVSEILPGFKKNLWIVVCAKGNAVGATFQDLHKELLKMIAAL